MASTYRTAARATTRARWLNSPILQKSQAGTVSLSKIISSEQFTPDDVRALKAFVECHRTTSGPFDIALGGVSHSEDWEQERVLIRALAEAGATWWVEYLSPELGGLDEMRRRIARGPLRID